MKITRDWHVRHLFAISAANILLAAAGCGEPELRSNHLDRMIMIDGNEGEWGGLCVFEDAGSGSRISAANDDEDLFLCLSTSNPRTQAEVLRNGLTVWFDREGGKDARFGINYPMRSFSERSPAVDQEGRRPPGGPESLAAGVGGDQPPDLRLIELLLDDIPGALMIIGPDEDARLTCAVEETARFGIETAIALRDGRLVYELRIPLAPSAGSVYTVGTGPAATLGIGFLAGKTLMSGNMPPGGMRPPGGPDGGMGGPGGGMGMPGRGPGGPRAGGGMGDRPRPLETWVRLRLAYMGDQPE
ncbi:MAG TPA: hypothetical protein VLA34_05290 [Candidatus Krumholzibacterium sp.]|nr:hypothetical protein [Candidatus Krumholzibacterium sp.]